MRRPLLAAAALLIAVTTLASPAGAQTDVLDSRLDFTSVDTFISPEGNLWFELTPREPWVDGMITDLFSWFFAVDISGDTDAAGALLQVHDGVVTSNGFTSTADGTKERQSEILLGPGGDWIRIDVGLSRPLVDEPLFWAITSATMDTPSGIRNESLGYSGTLLDNVAEANPLVGAVSRFEVDGFMPIPNPIPADLPVPTETAAPASTAAPKPTTAPAPTAAPEESAATASTAPVSAAGGSAGGSGASKSATGNSTSWWVFSIAVFLIGFAMFLFMRGRRTKRRGLDVTSSSTRLDEGGASWDFPNEMMQLITDMPEDERRKAIDEYRRADNKADYVKYAQDLQKFHTSGGGMGPPDKPAGI